ncbi:MAG: hypothetical protein WAT09_08890 [Paracoccaceae bacterium]
MIRCDLGLVAALSMAVAIPDAACVRGCSGFGYSSIMVSAALLLPSPLHLVAVVIALGAWPEVGQC